MRKNILLTGSLALSLFVSGLPSIAPLQAESPVEKPKPFSCGPNMDTYVVHSLDPEATGTGVRCVKWSDGSATKKVPVFAWYGEGNWRGYAYRHVGQAFVRNAKEPNVYRGYAADIYGNGEQTQGDYPGNLIITIVDANTIRVTNVWYEEWTKVTEVNYTSLAAPTTCGPLFDEYHAYSIDAMRTAKNLSQAAQAGKGLRCVLKSGYRNTTWYGVGNWDGKVYAHLATGSTKGWGASDFCRSTQDYCADFAYGAIRRRISQAWQRPVIDGWNEIWFKQKPVSN